MIKERDRDRDRDRESNNRKPSRFGRRKVCRFCVEKLSYVDYKDIPKLQGFITDRGKIIPRRISGNCNQHQHMLTTAIKRARNVALLPFVAE